MGRARFVGKTRPPPPEPAALPPAAAALAPGAADRAARPGPRGRGRGSGGSPAQLPRLSELAVTAQPAAKVALLTVRLYATDAAWLGTAWPAQPLWQLALAHQGRPSFVTDFVRHFRNFLEHRARNDADSPATLQDLRVRHNVHISVGSSADKHHLGATNDVAGFYVVGEGEDVVNALGLLNEFLQFRLDATLSGGDPVAAGTTLQAFSPLSGGDSHDFAVVFADFDALPTSYQRVPALPVDVFAARPPGPICDAPTLQLEWGSEGDELFGVLGGLTYPFRAALNRANISSARHAETDQFYRIWPRCRIDAAGNAADFDELHRAALNLCPMLLTVLTMPPEDTNAALFLQKVRSCPTISLRLPGVPHRPFSDVTDATIKLAAKPELAPASAGAASKRKRGTDDESEAEADQDDAQASEHETPVDATSTAGT